MIKPLGWIGEAGLSGSLDILFVAFILYTLLVWSKKTRSASILIGIVIVAGIYLITKQLNMILAAGLLEQFFKIILIALVIIFQEELRYFFEQIAVWSTGRNFGKKKAPILSRGEVDILARTLNDLARDRIGALIVIRGKDLVIRHLEGGEEIDAKLSEPLLKSLFDPHSIGHDGALFIKDDRVVKFSCHLPLSKNLKQVGKGGTRHSAALGLSELCDALCLVVSEERGTISVARNGELKIVADPGKLSSLILDFYEEVNPKLKVNHWRGFLFKNYKEKVVGFILAILIWLVLVYGSKQTYKTYLVPASYEPIGPGYTVESIEPSKAYVTLGGPRHAFYFFDSNQIQLVCQLDKNTAVQQVNINPANLIIPRGLRVEFLAPERIHFKVGKIVAPNDFKTNVLSKDAKAVSDKRALPAQAGADNGKPVASGDVSVPAPSQNQAPMNLKVRTINQLEDAKPEDVEKYVEKKLEQGAGK